jgi:gliding motility-associated-like protein
MKYILSLVCLVFISSNAWAQPSNDECTTAINLGVVPNCDGMVYTNLNATASIVAPVNSPTCFNGGVAAEDVFFTFTLDPSIVDVTVTIEGVGNGPNGQGIINPQFVIYRGACGGLTEILCASATFGTNSVTLDATGLTPGIPYFIRVNDYSASGTPNWGDFTLCIEEYVPSIIMGESTFSNSCEGTLVDSGGEDGDYSNNENSTFTVCPTEFSACIAIDVSFFSMLDGDRLTVYDGPTTNGFPQIASLTGNSDGSQFDILSISGSECITFEFVSNGFGTGAGFELTWQCLPEACEASSFNNPTPIGQVPYSNTGLTTCGQGATFNTTPCTGAPFLNGPERVFLYQSPGGLCASVQVINAEPGTGVLVLNGLPDDPGTVCVAQAAGGFINTVNFQEPGDYYIVVANAEGCTDFGLVINPTECTLSPALVDALCNPLNGCIQPDQLTTQFIFEDGFQDVPIVNGLNNGCWGGVGIEPDFFWFTIEAQADGPFGFIVQSANIPSDIDFNVWGPFTPEQVCETPQFVINAVSTTQPIRSSYDGGTEPTGLADIHPAFGYPVVDNYDCQGIADDVVSAIPAQQGEVYVVLLNDWGNQIVDGGMLVDWGPSSRDVLAPLGTTVEASDTSVCAGQSVQLNVVTGLDNIEWFGDNASELSCTNCFNPIATPAETRTYRAILDAVCYTDTLDVVVNVFDLDAGPDLTVCIGETFEIPAGQDFNTATYQWAPPAELVFSCTDCPTPTVTATASGTFQVPVTLTAAACNFSDIVTINVLAGTNAAVYTIADSQTICEGESIAIGGAEVAGNTYLWTAIPDGGNVPSVANPEVQPTATTTYLLTVTGPDCPVPSRDSVTVTVTPLPLVDLAPINNQVCQGDTILLANQTTEAGVVYAWTGPNEILTPDTSLTLVAPVVSGTFTLTADRAGCVVSEGVAVDVVEIALDLNQADTTLICVGETVQVNATVQPAGATVVWNIPTVTGSAPLLSPQTYTEYSATVTIGQCVRTDAFAIQVDSLPTQMGILADPMEDSYCEGELVVLSSPVYDPVMYPDIIHSWVGPGQETSDTLYNMVLRVVDTFTYVRTTINGGCMQEDEITLNVIRIDGADITPVGPICPGESVQLTIADPSLNAEFTWSPAQTLSCDDCPTPVATPDGTTTYMLEVEVEGCTADRSVTVAVLPLPVLNAITDRTICAGTTLELNPAGGQPGFIYTWTATGFNSALPNPVVTPAVTTTYIGTASNQCGTVTDEVVLTVIEPGQLLGIDGPDVITLCRGEELALNANVVTSANGQNSLVWFYDGESNLGAATSFTATQSGFAIFVYQYGIAANQDCAELRDSVFIQVNDAPAISGLAAPETLCSGDGAMVRLSTAQPEPGVVYTWASSTDPAFTSSALDLIVSPTVTTTYTLTAALGECTATGSVTLTVLQPATLEAGPDQAYEEGASGVTVTAAFTNATEGEVSWQFEGSNVGTGGSAMISSAILELVIDSLPSYAYVTLTTGCETLVDSVQIVLQGVKIPNIFSPNGDELNDVFRPFFATDVDALEVRVYNRWGKLVFESNDTANTGWDGKVDSKDAPSDVYIYSINYTLRGAAKSETGEVTLVR